MTNQHFPDSVIVSEANSHAEIETQHVLKSLTQVMKSGVMICDRDLKITFICTSVSTMLDIPDHLLSVGADYRDLLTYMCEQELFGEALTLSNLDNFMNKIKADLETGKTENLQWENKTEAGKRLRHNTICSAEGILIVYIEDITEQSRSTEIAEMAFSIGDAGYWTLQFDTDIYHLSNTIQDKLTLDEIASVEKNGWWDLLHPDDVEKTRLAWQQAFATGEKMDFVHRITSQKSGTRHFRNIGYPEISTSGKPVGTICFFIDVTAQVEAAADLRSAKETAERALQSANDFLAEMSHEIRTPMNGVLGMTDALLNSPRGDAAREELSVIKRSAENLLEVLNDTLDMAKLKAKSAPILLTDNSPRSTIKDAGQLWQKRAADNGTQLRIRLHESVPETLKFDRRHYEQCLNNILSNAVKFTKDGTISVISKMVENNGRMQFMTAIKDTGIGMTPDQQKRIFIPYSQGDETIRARFGGTGLGMSITKNLVDLMGGTLRLQSAQGKGTTFLITLPTSIPAANPAPVAAEISKTKTARVMQGENTVDIQKSAPQNGVLPQVEIFDDPRSKLSRLNVLVAEDNDTNRMVIKALFEHVFGTLHFAENGKKAIDILETCQVDIVLMDIHMPVMDGIEATLAIRSSNAPYRNVPIIALTADPEYQQKRVCMNIGMDGAHAKPVNREELIEGCISVLEARRVSQTVPNIGLSA